MFTVLRKLVILLVCVSVLPALAEQVSKEQIKGLDEQVQDIKKDVLAISSELNLLEEKLLFPSNTQVALFVSLDAGKGFELDAMEIEVDGKVVANHIYSFNELDALQNGGVQRIFTGNVLTGKHALRVGFKGKSSLGNQFTEEASYTFSKGVGPGIVEIRIKGASIGSGSVEFVER